MKGSRLLAVALLLSCCIAVHSADTEPTPPTDTEPAPEIEVEEEQHAQFDPSSLDTVLAFATTDNDTYVKDLFELVAIPSISALPDHASDVLTAAGWLKLRLATAGLENVQVLHTEGPQPVVSPRMLLPQCPTPEL